MSTRFMMVLGMNSLEVDGDICFDDRGFVRVVKAWMRAASPESNPELDELTDQLASQTDELAAAVETHTV